MNFFQKLVDGSFMPHGHCLLWRSDLLWLNVGGDMLTTCAYMLIPMALIHLIRKRDDLAFDWVFMMFAAFIFLCGVTHAVGIVNTWHGFYFFEGMVKLGTGLVSMLTALMVWKLMPKALAIPSTVQLKAQNESLARAESELLQANSRLEQRVEERTRELEKLAVTDSLTGGWNRREIMSRMGNEIERCQRHQHDFSIMMIDLDYFKKINDVYGHQTGDLVLFRAADAFRSNCRRNDMVGRYGGEEFLVLLPDTGLEEAKIFAERIRHEIEMLEIETDQGVNVDCRCSIGVASFDRSLSETAFIAEADKALYRAKMNGRNCVAVAND